MANKTNTKTGIFPVIALRDVVAFPHILFHLEIEDPRDITSAENALTNDGMVYLVALRRSDNADPQHAKDFENTGIVGKITSSKEESDGRLTLTVEGLTRATIMTYYPDSACAAVIARENAERLDTDRIQKAHDRILATIDNIAQFVPKFSKELSDKLRTEGDMSLFADAIAFYVLVSPEHKQQVLDCRSVAKRLELVDKLLDSEIAILQEDLRLHNKVRQALEQNQRDYYLREQLRIVKEELGMNEEDEEATEYLKQIAEKNLPEDVEHRLVKEVASWTKRPTLPPKPPYCATIWIPFLKFPLENSPRIKPM